MTNRILGITLLISLAVHIIGMSLVTIVTPQGMSRMPSYTRVDFLGAVFKKAAFDIMLENTTAFLKDDAYAHMTPTQQGEYLKTVVSKQKLEVQQFPEYLEDRMDNTVRNFLMGNKIIPDFFSNFETKNFVRPKRKGKPEKVMRKIIYYPESSFIQHGLYGNEKSFKVKFKALLGTDGKIKRTELIATTGYPQLDITASKLIKEWIFESTKHIKRKDEWCEIEVILNTGS